MLYPDGGSPNSEDLWAALGEQTPATVLGMSLHKALKEVVKQTGRDERLLSNYAIPENFEVASDLRVVLESALQKKAINA
jgi:hypothetical protein